MDSLVEEVGPYGKFQKCILLITGAITAVASMVFYVTIFNTAEPHLSCYLKSNSTIFSNAEVTKELKCNMWNNYSLSIEQSTESPYECSFDLEHYETTIINDWGLVCEKQHLAGLTQTIFLIGNISAFLSGIIADKYGRKMASIIFIALFSIFSVIFCLLMNNFAIFYLSISTRYIIYNVFQLISGILTCCFQMSVYVHGIEFTSDDYHILFGNMYSYFYIAGEVLVMMAYYFYRDWIIANWFITIFTIVFLVPYCLCVPESPRWLAELDRFDESYEVLQKMAKVNNKKNFKDNRELTLKLMQTQSAEKKIEKELTESSMKSSVFSLRNIFGDNFNYLKLTALFVVFNSATLIYVGVTVGITSLIDINPYIIFLCSSLFELFGIVICHLNDYIGRKRSLIIFLALLSFFSLCVAFLPDTQTYTLIAKTLCTLFARIFISASYNILLVYTAELYEVKIRNTILAFLTCLGCLLSLFSPQINLLQDVWRPIPYLIYSGCAMLCLFIISFLPETYRPNSDKGI